MKFIPIGIATETDFLNMLSADDFSDERYDGVQLRKGKNNKAVVILHSKTPAPKEWKVAYGYSKIFFDTLKEAVTFCEERGMKLLDGK